VTATSQAGRNPVRPIALQHLVIVLLGMCLDFMMLTVP
jgi:hypothetical protein